MGSFDFSRGVLFGGQLLYTSIEARLSSSSGILLDHHFFSCLVESFLSFLVPLLRGSEITFLDSLEGALGRTLDHTFNRTVAGGVFGRNPHIFFGRLLDWHRR